MTENLLAQTLKKLIATYGLILIRNDKRLETLLLEYCGTQKKKINALTTAIRFGIIDQLLKIPMQTINQCSIDEMGYSLHQDTDLPLELTKWSVMTWADVLQVSLPLSQPEAYQNLPKTTLEKIQPKKREDKRSIFIPLDDDIHIELLKIPAGEFLMGSSDKDQGAFDIEKPQHIIFLPEFYIGKYPITNVQFNIFRIQNKKSSPYPPLPPEYHTHPVTGICWDDAMEFCDWLNAKSDLPIRLPTEAEWEKAARGVNANRWPWGNDLPNRLLCNSDGLVGNTTPVGSYSPQGDSPFGCADMSGNVWEWTSTVLMPYPYDPTDGRENSRSRQDRVLRGGSFHYNSLFARCTVRVGGSPDLRSRYFGFRIVISAQEKEITA